MWKHAYCTHNNCTRTRTHTHARKRTYARTLMHANVHAHTHTLVHARTDTHTLLHARTHTLMHARAPACGAGRPWPPTGTPVRVVVGLRRGGWSGRGGGARAAVVESGCRPCDRANNRSPGSPISDPLPHPIILTSHVVTGYTCMLPGTQPHLDPHTHPCRRPRHPTPQSNPRAVVARHAHPHNPSRTSRLQTHTPGLQTVTPCYAWT